MANGVNTEWFDLQVKHNNYLPKEKQRSLTQIQMQAQQKHEEENRLQNQLEKKNMEELNEMEDDLDFDDQFMRQYMAKRRVQIKEEAQKFKFGEVIEISRDQYVREVTNAEPEYFVVLHLYQNSNEFCVLINQHMPAMAKKYGEVKFVKIIADKCIQKFPDEHCPCFIIYKGGKPVAHITNVDKHMGGKVDNFSLFLKGHGIVEQE